MRHILSTPVSRANLGTRCRTKPGIIVTKARGGYSGHNFGIAWDIDIFDHGRYLEETPPYTEAGVMGEKIGLEWCGRWKFTDEPHFQLKLGLPLAKCRSRIESGQRIL